MRYTTFGRASGLRVSRYALGTANFGTARGGGAEEDASRAMFERFADAGGASIDTADVYSNGDSERMLAKFIGADRGHFVLATKYGQSAGDVGISTTGDSRKNMVQSLESSLGRLGTDYVDVLWVHWPDPLTPTDEIMAGLNDLVRSGKVLYAGLSNFPAWQAARAATLAELRGWAPLTAVQFEYSLAERSADRDLLSVAEAFGLGVSTYMPLGGGLLTGKYRHATTGRLQDWNGAVLQKEDSRQKTQIIDAVLAVAAETILSPAQVCLAWLLGRQPAAATPHVPIIGPRTVDHLDANFPGPRCGADRRPGAPARPGQRTGPSGHPTTARRTPPPPWSAAAPRPYTRPRCQSASRCPPHKSGSIWPPEPGDATENEPRRRI